LSLSVAGSSSCGSQLSVFGCWISVIDLVLGIYRNKASLISQVRRRISKPNRQPTTPNSQPTTDNARYFRNPLTISQLDLFVFFYSQGKIRMLLSETGKSSFKSFWKIKWYPTRQRDHRCRRPNGCGKSNVVRCIRWCVGTKARNARSDKMENVIFHAPKPVSLPSLAECLPWLWNTNNLLQLNIPTSPSTRRYYPKKKSGKNIKFFWGGN